MDKRQQEGSIPISNKHEELRDERDRRDRWMNKRRRNLYILLVIVLTALGVGLYLLFSRMG